MGWHMQKLAQHNSVSFFDMLEHYDWCIIKGANQYQHFQGFFMLY